MRGYPKSAQHLKHMARKRPDTKADEAEEVTERNELNPPIWSMVAREGRANYTDPFGPWFPGGRHKSGHVKPTGSCSKQRENGRDSNN